MDYPAVVGTVPNIDIIVAYAGYVLRSFVKETVLAPLIDAGGNLLLAHIALAVVIAYDGRPWNAELLYEHTEISE